MAGESEESQGVIRAEVERLFLLYADDMYRYARYTLHDAADAQDVVQDVFLKAFRGWGTFKGETGERQWLYAIARNTLIDRIRRKRSRRLYEERSRRLPLEQSVQLDSLMELEEALQCLKPLQRQVFILRCVQDESVEATAQILQCSQARVKTTLHRAIRSLRSALSAETITACLGDGQNQAMGVGLAKPSSDFEGGYSR